MKLISVNIERNFHHETVLPFLLKEGADVVCIQEIFEDKVEEYAEALSMSYIFKPMGHVNRPNDRGIKDKGIVGIAILSKNIDSYDCKYIVGEENNIPVFEHTTSPDERNVLNILVMWANIKDKDGNIYTIANTHFTWTMEGLSTEYQREDARKLVNILDTEPKDFVLVGDTNAPRGRETFDFIASKYKDNIPLEYQTSLDQDLHRVKGLQYMIDCLFTTSTYHADNVKLVSGVSDHMAVVADIIKN